MQARNLHNLHNHSHRGGIKGSKTVVSWYGNPQRLAGGGSYNPSGFTAAHKSLPLGTIVRFSNPKNHTSVVVTINDRGPYVGGRSFDLSRGAAQALEITNQGVASISYSILHVGKKK